MAFDPNAKSRRGEKVVLCRGTVEDLLEFLQKEEIATGSWLTAKEGRELAAQISEELAEWDQS